MPAGFTVHKWRAATRSWMEERNDRLKVFGSDYWNFVLNWEVSVITELAMVGALSVLSEVMQVNFEVTLRRWPCVPRARTFSHTWPNL